MRGAGRALTAPVPARANIFYSVECAKDFMRKYLGMERSSSMEAVCDPSYDISCHVQWNVHGADTSSMRTWNHMLLAAKQRGAGNARDTARAREQARLFDEAESVALHARVGSRLATTPRAALQ